MNINLPLCCEDENKWEIVFLEETLVSIKSKSLGRDPTGKRGKSSQNYNNISKFLFQSTINPYKHICSFLRESHLSERRHLKILVKDNFYKFGQKSSFVKTTFTSDFFFFFKCLKVVFTKDDFHVFKKKLKKDLVKSHFL